jgi:hypothetical protein
LSSYDSLLCSPFIGQLCIAIPTNRSTPYRVLAASICNFFSSERSQLIPFSITTRRL